MNGVNFLKIKERMAALHILKLLRDVSLRIEIIIDLTKTDFTLRFGLNM